VSTVVDGRTRVTIVSNPAGTQVSGAANTFDYPVLSNVTLTCMVNPRPSVPVTYRWNTEGCYRNSNDETLCFYGHKKTAQMISKTKLVALDAGTFICTATIRGVKHTSNEFTVRISGNLYCSI